MTKEQSDKIITQLVHAIFDAINSVGSEFDSKIWYSHINRALAEVLAVNLNDELAVSFPIEENKGIHISK